MNADDFDPIVVLVIDDQPDSLWLDTPAANLLPPYPGIAPDRRRKVALDRLFKVIWIATPEEAREYRALARAAQRSDPESLRKLGVIPDILLVDYLLKRGTQTVEQSLDGHADLAHEVSPLPRLRKVAPATDRSQERATFGRLPDSQANYGCFIGGMILSQFSEHPCVPLTTTANTRETIKNSMTEFFEWLLQDDTGGQLQATGPGLIQWEDLLPEAVSRLRLRLADLARQRRITLSLDDVIRLAAGEERKQLTVASRYGIQRYPIEGLFCDHADKGVYPEAKAWSKGMLELMLHELDLEELKRGKLAAERLWRAYENDALVDLRLELADLVRELRDRKLTPARAELLKQIWPEFSTAPLEAERLTQGDRTRVELDRQIVDIRLDLVDQCTHRVRRWAILFVLVRLVRLRQLALAKYHKREGQGEVEGKPLQPIHLYFALFPIAKDPLTLEDFTSGGGVKFIKGLNDPAKPAARESKMGNLGIDPEDLLAGIPRDEAAGTYGIHPSEEPILAWYALDVKFPPEQWGPYARSLLAPSQANRSDAER